MLPLRDLSRTSKSIFSKIKIPVGAFLAYGAHEGFVRRFSLYIDCGTGAALLRRTSRWNRVPDSRGTGGGCGAGICPGTGSSARQCAVLGCAAAGARAHLFRGHVAPAPVVLPDSQEVDCLRSSSRGTQSRHSSSLRATGSSTDTFSSLGLVLARCLAVLWTEWPITALALAGLLARDAAPDARMGM